MIQKNTKKKRQKNRILTEKVSSISHVELQVQVKTLPAFQRLSVIPLESRPISNKMVQRFEDSESLLTHYYHNEMAISFIERSQQVQLRKLSWQQKKQKCMDMVTYGEDYTEVQCLNFQNCHGKTRDAQQCLVSSVMRKSTTRREKFLIDSLRGFKPSGSSSSSVNYWKDRDYGSPCSTGAWTQGKTTASMFINVSWEAQVKFPGSSLSPSRLLKAG